MTKLGLFFGTETGNTEYIATLISKEFKNELVMENIGKATVEQIQNCDRLIFGGPTWDDGELDLDWEAFLPNLDKIDFTGKKIALFGLGDQEVYADTFLEAIATIYDKVKRKGGIIIGEWSIEGYDYVDSSAIIGEKFVGLAIDEDNQSELSRGRIRRWVKQIKKEFR